MRNKRPATREEFNSELERRWLATARPPKTNAVINTIIFVVVLAALCAAAYLNRVRIGVLWQQMTGKAPSRQVAP